MSERQPAADASHVRHEIITITKLLLNRGLVPYPAIVELLHGIDRAHPALRFRDFITATDLAALNATPKREPQ